MLVEALNQHSGLVSVTGVNASHSPELIKNNEKACSKSDIFALGAIAYQMATNKPPFSGKDSLKRSSQILAGEIDEFPAEIKIHKDLKKLILSMLATDKAARPSLDDILNKVDKLKTVQGL